MSQSSVGVGVASIRVSDPLTPGQIYKLPALPVINTGDAYACFSMSVDPANSQIEFSKNTVCLDPGKSELVNLKLTLPIDAIAGKREYVLEVKKEPDGGEDTKVSPAVGTYLSYTIGQSPGILGAFRQRVNSWWALNFAFGTALAVIFCLVLAVFLFRRAFNFKISLKK